MREVQSGLEVKRAGVHIRNEFHNGDAEFGIAVSDRGFDRGRAAVFGEERRVDVEDAGWLEEVKKVFFDDDAERGEDGGKIFVAFF